MTNPRVVLTYACGVSRILGIFEPGKDQAYPLIEFTDAMHEGVLGPKCQQAGLVGATPRMVLYREIV
jgi:hypothetical protein